MINNNQINWDEIPEDVEAVVTYISIPTPNYYKTVYGKLMCQRHRHEGYEIVNGTLDDLRYNHGYHFHLRPSPITEPTPEPPESTQVETSEVEAATTPEFDWSSVDSDVEAVLFNLSGDVVQHLKTLDGSLYFKVIGFMDHYIPSGQYSSLSDREENIGDFLGGATLLRRPTATTPTPEKVTCKVEFYEGESPEGMISLDEEFKPPSISTILQEAQQSILKHHGITGKVAFISHIS